MIRLNASMDLCLLFDFFDHAYSDQFSSKRRSGSQILGTRKQQPQEEEIAKHHVGCRICELLGTSQSPAIPTGLRNDLETHLPEVMVQRQNPANS
jgi:hypothetical protein